MKIDFNNRFKNGVPQRTTCAARTTSTATSSAASPLQKILVPLDFSDFSTPAIQSAVSFAGQFQAQIILLHVVPVNYSTILQFPVSGHDSHIEAKTWKKLETQLTAMALENVPTGLPTQMLLRYGSPAIEIMKAAAELEVDLIIMATHGHTGRAHALVGSVAGDVTRLAPCPVLVVHKHEHGFLSGKCSHLPAGQKPGTTTTTASEV